MKISGNKILITGGASGIGLGLTERFIKEGNTVLVCGRREGVLKEINNKLPQLITKKYDLSKEDERISLFEWITIEHSDLNVLVNNAGIQQGMNINDDNFYTRSKEEIEINAEAPLHLSHLFIKLEKINTIINVTSGLAFVPLVKVPVYCATKAFMRSFTLSLRQMVKPRNIEVIEIIPPALNTDLGGKGIHDFAPPVSGFIDAVFEQLNQGKTEIMWGFSENMLNASAEELRNTFNKMNQVK